MRLVYNVFLLLFFTSAWGQTRHINLNNVATVKVPAEAIRGFSTERENEKYPGKRSELFLDEDNGPINIFNTGFLQIKAQVVNVKASHLKDHKWNYDYRHQYERPYKNYSSEIRSFSNYEVLVIKYDEDHFNCVRFIAVNKSLDRAAGGVIEFEEAERDQVEQFFYGLIRGLKFKK